MVAYTHRTSTVIFLDTVVQGHSVNVCKFDCRLHYWGDSVNDVVIVAIISLIGTLGGTFGGILTASKLTNYRIEQLEKKVEKHNSVVERTFILEGQMLEAQHDIRDIKQKI